MTVTSFGLWMGDVAHGLRLAQRGPWNDCLMVEGSPVIFLHGTKADCEALANALLDALEDAPTAIPILYPVTATVTLPDLPEFAVRSGDDGR